VCKSYSMDSLLLSKSIRTEEREDVDRGSIFIFLLSGISSNKNITSVPPEEQHTVNN
jgi:hypothetical protein